MAAATPDAMCRAACAAGRTSVWPSLSSSPSSAPCSAPAWAGRICPRPSPTSASACGAVSAAVACLVRAKSFAGRMRWGWALIGLGVLSWGVGQVLLGLPRVVPRRRGAVPVRRPTSATSACSLLTAGRPAVPAQSPPRALANRARSVLDGLMVAASLLLIAGSWSSRRLIEAGGDSALALYISLSYPLGDVVIVTIVSTCWPCGASAARLRPSAGARRHRHRRLRRLRHRVRLPQPDRRLRLRRGHRHRLVRRLLADPARRPHAGRRTPRRRGPSTTDSARAVRHAAAVRGGARGAGHQRRPGSPGPVERRRSSSYTRSALILLIVGRQLLTLLENRNLTRNLEARVADRTPSCSPASSASTPSCSTAPTW